MIDLDKQFDSLAAMLESCRKEARTLTPSGSQEFKERLEFQRAGRPFQIASGPESALVESLKNSISKMIVGNERDVECYFFNLTDELYAVAGVVFDNAGRKGIRRVQFIRTTSSYSWRVV